MSNAGPMRTVDWSALAASSPINRDAGAAWVYSYEGEEPILLSRVLTCIPAAKARDPNFVDFTGMKKGRLTVIGYAGPGGHKSNRSSRWVVRCVCGRYEIRSKKALRPECDSNSCSPCRKVIQMRAGLYPSR